MNNRVLNALAFLMMLAMLFGGGLALGRYAGYGGLRVGFAMAGLDTRAGGRGDRTRRLML